MNRVPLKGFSLLAVLFAVLIGLVCGKAPATAQQPAFESEIAAFEKADRLNPPPQGRIIFIGSSSIRLWSTLAEDMKHSGSASIAASAARRSQT